MFRSETGMICFETRTVYLVFAHNLKTSPETLKRLDNLTTPIEFVGIFFSLKLAFYPLEETLFGFLYVTILQHQQWSPKKGNFLNHP